jgi:hypothetical protein
MGAFRRLAFVIFTFTLTLAIVCDVVLALGLLGHLCSGGLRGMNGWIMHIGTEGRIRVVQIGPERVRFEFPSKASVYREFGVTCAFLLMVTVGSWLGRRRLRRPAKAPLES